MNGTMGSDQVLRYTVRGVLLDIDVPSCHRPRCRRSELPGPYMKYICSSSLCIRTSCRSIGYGWVCRS